MGSTGRRGRRRWRRAPGRSSGGGRLEQGVDDGGDLLFRRGGGIGGALGTEQFLGLSFRRLGADHGAQTLHVAV